MRKGTWLTGKYSGRGYIPNIVYQLEEKNVFILGIAIQFGNSSLWNSNWKFILSSLKMVKIRVTGITTFDWLEARYIMHYPEGCGKQSTFHEGCFRGELVTQFNFDVDLFAIVVESKGITRGYF